MSTFIEKTRDRVPLSTEDIESLIDGIVADTIPDYQVAAWLMAAYLNGLTDPEVFSLTKAMAESGTGSQEAMGLVDKHSTGGVGDKTSLILAPLMASLGVPMLKMSGRGLGHTGGTLDKLESLPGFRVDLDPVHLSRQMRSVGVAIVAQSPTLAPSDARLYALRDVTGTVDSIPLIAASIMSKKLAAKAPNIVLDVKVGSGAFMTDEDRAVRLAELMVRIGKAHHVTVKAILTNMDQPLGFAIGNAIEVNEAMATLKGTGPLDLTEESYILASHMLSMAHSVELGEANRRVEHVVRSGAAWQKFGDWVTAQGADPQCLSRDLPLAAEHQSWVLDRSLTVTRINTRELGLAALALGAGRMTKGQPVDHGVGIRCYAKIGQTLKPGTLVAEVYARTPEDAKAALNMVRNAIHGDGEPGKTPSGVIRIVE